MNSREVAGLDPYRKRDQSSQAFDLLRTEIETPEIVDDEINRFSQEQRDLLEKGGHIMYTLTGKSVRDLRESGRDARYDIYKPQYGKYDQIRSLKSEVAIYEGHKPPIYSREESSYIDFVKKFSFDIGNRIPGVKAVIGKLPDYVELAFLHYDQTDRYLYGYDSYLLTSTHNDGYPIVLRGLDYKDENKYILRYLALRLDMTEPNEVKTNPIIIPNSKS